MTPRIKKGRVKARIPLPQHRPMAIPNKKKSHADDETMYEGKYNDPWADPGVLQRGVPVAKDPCCERDGHVYVHDICFRCGDRLPFLHDRP